MSNRARPNGATDPPLTSDRQSSNGSSNGTPAPGRSDRESPQFSGQQMSNPSRPQSPSRPPFSDLPGASDRPGPTGLPGSTYPPGRTPPIIPPRAPESPASSSASSPAEQLSKGLSAARQAMREKTAAMMDAAAQASESRARQREAKAAERRAAQQRTDAQYAAQLRAAQNSSPGMPPGSPSGFPGGPSGRPAGVPGTPAETMGMPRTNPPSALSTPPTHRAAAQPTYGKAQAPRKSAARSTHRPTHRTRKARLRLARVDPWSVMKTAFLLSIAFGIVTWVMVFIVWSAIGAAGVFDNINSTVQEVLGTPGADPFRIQDYISTNKVMGFTTLLACADVLIITALATLGGFLYNIAASLLGGLEVTLASEE